MPNIDHLCVNLNARCNCNLAATDSGYNSAKMYRWNHSGRKEPLMLQPIEVNKELKQGQRREFKSFSYPDKSVIYARNSRKYSVDTTESTDKDLTDVSAIYSRGHPSIYPDAKYRFTSSSEQSKKIQLMNSRIDGAKQFFAQSGILGTANFQSSSDLIRKTSSIHIDATLKDQIRKTSLCLRSRICIEKNIPKSYDELIYSLQNEVLTLKGTINHGETKIITLRTEINKLKRALQEIMHVQMVASSNAGDGLSSTTICLFCQPRNWTSKI
ncbi:uncharacterized protein LOC113566253 [Drosophila persimilis]|uniref:uncharacterized protein LOC113566253 n=1 Tax=Drosophila persimilis TaxID=7234 RepID=UPI000F076FF4|nr:uncharacterized protein LOC113566253 [Drosophila persimilis]